MNFKIFLPSLISCLIFYLNENKLTKLLSFPLLAGTFLSLLAYGFLRKRNRMPMESKTLLLFSLVFLLSLISLTGWLFSPFFLLLYPLGVLMGGIFSFETSLAFVLTMAGIFIFKLKGESTSYDFIIILGFLTLLPLNYCLKKRNKK